MKKTVIILSVFCILSACSKETNTLESSRGIKKSGSYSDIEYYDNQQDVEETLSGFLSTMESSNNPEDLSLAEGVYLLEGAVNYKYRHQQGAFDKYDFSDENKISVSVNLTTSGEMDGSSLKEAFLDMNSTIANHIETSGAKLHVVDVSVDTIANSIIELTARPVYGIGNLTAVSNFSYNAQADRQAGVAVQCDGVTPKNNNGAEYTSLLANRLLVSNQALCNGYPYYVNVQNYSSVAANGNFISHDNLLGHPSAVVGPAYWVAPQTCVSITNLNAYRDQAVIDVSNLLSQTSLDFIGLDIFLEHYLCGCQNITWGYGSVDIGEINCSNITPSYSY